MWRSIHRRFWLSPVPNNEKFQDPKFSFLFLSNQKGNSIQWNYAAEKSSFPRASVRADQAQLTTEEIRKKFFFLERQFRQIANLLIIYLAEKQEKEERKIIIILFKKSIRLHLVIVLGKNRKKEKENFPKYSLSCAFKAFSFPFPHLRKSKRKKNIGSHEIGKDKRNNGKLK